MAQQSEKQESDEIDLGDFFNAVGAAFNRFIGWFRSLFIGFGQFVIEFLLFIKKYFRVIVIMGILGLTAGLIADYLLPPKYVSKMVLEPNFNSTQQLYNNIEYYNNLADSQDSINLARTLNIETGEAALIDEISIESFADRNQKIRTFDQFIKGLDSTTRQNIDIKSYLNSFNSLDAQFHRLALVARDPKIAKKIQEPLLNSISKNSYFQLQKKTNEENISLQETLLNQELADVDSLQVLYRRVMLKQAENSFQGTQIDLAEGGGSTNTEITVIDKKDDIKTKLIALNTMKANTLSILNVISEFPENGVSLKGVFNEYKYLFPILGVAFGFLFGLLIELNGFLNRYQSEKEKAA